MSSESLEVFAVHLSELKESLQEVTVAGKTVLFSRTQTGLYATSPKCPHYGAPLVKGVLSGDRILCPWHGACFNVCSGDLEDHPSYDSLHSFPVRVEGDNVFITLPGPDSVPQQRSPHITHLSQEVSQPVVVIVGGGAGGSTAAQTLRAHGFQGRVILISAEKYVPYDRPKLSKNLAVSPEAIAVRPAKWYEEAGIEIWLNSTVTELDAATKTITLADGKTVSFDECIVCTGSRPFNIPVPGHNLGNIFTLRSPEDAHQIDALATPDSKVVLVGTGFIGLELASYLKSVKKVASVTAVSLDKAPLERVLGVEVGNIFKKIHEDQGVKLMLDVHISSYVGENGKVTGVVIAEQKEAIPADLVVVGAGVRLNTEFLKNVELFDREKSVVVDQYMRSSSGIYAAGDIVRFPYAQDGGHMTRIEHWAVAQNQARVAALNILGKKVAFSTVPYFWTVQFPGSLRYTGHCDSFDDVLVMKGDEKKFVALYVSKGKVAAVATLGSDPISSAASELFRLDKFPSVADIKAGKYPDAASLLKLLQ